MIKLFQKLLALIETLIAVVSPAIIPTPTPVVDDQPIVAVVATNSPSVSVSASPVVFIPTPTPIKTPAPKIEDVVVRLEELKNEIVNYVPEVTPTPTIIYLTPIPTPVLTPPPTPSPTPEPVFRSVPVSFDQFITDVMELSPNALSKIDSCAEKYPLSVIFYAGKKLLYMEHKDVNVGMIEGLSRELTDPENKGGDYWDCMAETLSVSGFVPFGLYGLKPDDQSLVIFQRLLIEYLK